MMNKIKNNFNTILIIFILIQPVLDLITSCSIHLLKINLTLGIIIRLLFLIFVMLSAIFIYKKKNLFWIYFISFLYFIFYVVGLLIFKDNISLFAEVQGLLRVFYFPLLLISLYSLRKEINISNLVLGIVLLIYIIFIFIPTIFDLGFKTYEITKEGTLGFFNSANEISAILSLLTPIMIILLKGKKQLLLKNLFILMYIYVIVSIGTKTPLLSLIITLFITFIYLFVKCIKKKNYKIITASITTIIIVIIMGIVFIPKTIFYKNIKTHLDYLKLESVTEVFTSPKLIDHFIFSQRLTFLNNKNKLYQESSTYQKFFGIGYLKNNKATKMIEMDYFDIYYSHGVVGFILFFGIYLYVFLNILKEKSKFSFDRLMLITASLLIIFLSLFTGHIITSPAVSLIVCIIILKLDSKKKKLLFTGYDLNIGGIETSLVNLVNKINLNKYDVSIILEKKEGPLIKKLNKKIEVKELKVSLNSNPLIRKLINVSRKTIFSIANYHLYDFSCCYATYSLSGEKLTKLASTNSSIYIHSNYKYIYNELEFKEFFNKRKIEEFKKIIFVSNESKQDFLSIYPNLKDKCLVINNFINIDKIKKLSTESVEITKKSNKKLLVFVGRLDDKSKKLSRAINLIKEINQLQLLVVGDGPDKEKYLKEVEKYNLGDKIKFVGSKENPYCYMKEADYIILTSNYEGFPVIYLEAIALNKKIITTIDVSDDEINIGKDAAYIISKDENRMVKEVKEIIKSNKKTRKIDLDTIQNKRIKKLESIFDEVI